MAVETSQNPLQAGLQNLGNWFNSLPRPQIRLPWQQQGDRSSSPAPSSGSPSAQGSKDGLTYSSQTSASTSFRAQSSTPDAPIASPQVGPVDKDGLGRATWTFLHVLAAQFPEHPTKSQQKDVRSLVSTRTHDTVLAYCAAGDYSGSKAFQMASSPLAAKSGSRVRVSAQVDVLTRIYPCAECAEHFREVIRCLSLLHQPASKVNQLCTTVAGGHSIAGGLASPPRLERYSQYSALAHRHHPPKVDSGATLRLWMCEVHNEVNKSISKPNFNCKFVDSRWGALDCGDQLACALPSAK